MGTNKTKPDKHKTNPSKKESNRSKYLKVTFYLIFVGFAFYFTAIFNKDLLLKLDELSIFLSSRLFFTDHLGEPAGLLSYASSFLNQFFYYPWLGSVLFISLLIAVQVLSYRVFKISDRYFLWSFIPSFALLLLVTQLDYVMYEFIANGYAFMHVLGVIVSYLSFLSYKKISQQWLKYTFALFYILFFYPLIGFYALLSALLMALYEVKSEVEKGSKKQSILVGILLFTFILVPYTYYKNIYQVTMGFAYTAGLPEFQWTNDELLYWLPVILLVLSQVFFSIQSLFKKISFKPGVAFYLNISCGVAMLLIVYIFSNRDENFHTELAIDHALFENNWSEVLKIERNLKDEPSRYIVMTSRLALQKMHKAGDLMFTLKDGYKKPQAKRDLSLWSYAAQPVLYNYGMANDCYRWCMEDMARFGPKVQYLRYMVKCALINNEIELADKYNAALAKTLFHKKWAKKYQRYIEQPDLINDDPEFKNNRQLYTFPDDLISDNGNLESYILARLTSIGGGHLDLLELSMQAQMLLKNPEQFWPFFNLYVQKNDHIPVHYQEAALLFSQMNKQLDISNIKFDKEIVDQFNQVFSDPGNKQQEHFKKYYGNTYWYYMYHVKL